MEGDEMETRKPAEIDGVLVIHKPEGMTSHDVINRLRRRFKQKKFGHTGTLDPMASGVLVVLAGRALKISQFLTDTDKQYIAGIELGSRYDTDDIWGHLQQSAPVRQDFDFQKTLDTFRGPLHQRVPDTSAKKVNGKKLMEYQRENREVPAVYADVEIYDIQALDRDRLLFQVSCSSGTYVRSICRDFGEKTGNLAAMNSLVRTRACGFELAQAQDLETENLTVYPMETVLDLPQVAYSPVQDIYNGKSVRIDTDASRVLIMDQGRGIAVYDRDHANVFRCKRGLWA